MSDAKVGLQDARVGLDDVGRALGDGPAAVEHDHVVAQAHDEVTPEQVAAQFARYDVQEPAPVTPPACSPEGITVTDVMGGENWAPRTPSKWQFPGEEIILAEAGTNPNDGIRRPFEYAVLSSGPELASFEMAAEVKLDESVLVNNRDVILVFGHTSDTEYYYAHLSKDNTIYAHNGIFKVDGKDRERIDDQWNGTLGAPPAVTDDDWHDVRLVRCVETGEIAVYLDGLERPLLTATDTTFTSGRAGFGSFDNFGRLRNLTVTTSPTQGPEVPEFGDVTEGVQFYEEIRWLAERGVTTGWLLPDGTSEFRPVTPVARDAMAAFLYRLAGSPEFTAPEISPFSDVATDNLFYNEIAWLADGGISTGWDNGDGTASFRPLAPIARDAMAAFLDRYAEVSDHEAPATSPFSDVGTGDAFYAEITWLAASGIATGWTGDGNDGTDIFRPLNPVNRDAMAAFMYRLENPAT